jgi:hypothetical protein
MRLPSTNRNAVASEIILSQCLGEHISFLVSSTNREDLDESLANVFTEMMVTDVDMLGAWTKLGKSGKFQCSRIVFKDFAIDVRLGIDDWDIVAFHFLNELHDWNDISKRHGHSNVFSFSRREGSLSLEFRSPDDGATSIENDPTAARLGGTGINIGDSGCPIS